MESLLKELKENFNNYIKGVDDFYVKSTENYQSLFKEDKSGIFCRAISHIIRQFLTEEEADSLFIEVPVDELATKENKQAENFLQMENAIGHTLAMAVYPDFIEAPTIENTKEGNFYYSADEIKGRPRLWKIEKGKNTGKLYPDEQFKDRRGNIPVKVGDDAPTLREIFNKHHCNTYRLKSLPGNFHRPAREKMAKMAELLDVYRANKTTKRYNNALLIGFGSPKNIISNYSYIDYPLEFTHNYNNIENSKEYDIIVCVGDCHYKGYEMRLNQLLTKDKTKKIIYIGINHHKDFRGKVFSFSYREMYHYYANDKFPSVKINYVKWDNLECVINKNSSIFRDECLKTIPDIDKIERRVNSYIIKPYLGIENDTNFQEESFQDNILNFINEYFSSSIDDDQWNYLVNSFDNLSLPDLTNNPKSSIFDRIKTNRGKKSEYFFLRSNVYNISRIRDFCKNHNNNRNAFAVDVYIDSKKYYIEKVVKVLFKKLALGTFHLVVFSFFKLNEIATFLLKETKVYNQEYRKKLLNNITYTASSFKRQEYGTLDNFNSKFDLDVLNDYLKESERYILTDEAHQTYDISGELIRCNQLINTDELYEYKEDWLPCELSFYQSPENFQQLRDILYDLPKDKNIDTYSNLWKSRMQERCKNEYKGNSNEMREKDNFKFLDEQTFNNIVNDRYRSVAPRCYKLLFNRMRALGLLNEQEYKYCYNARAASKQGTKIGKILKEGIYEYILTGKCTIQDVNTICSNSENRENPITLDILKDLCIKTITITDITPINKHNDDE